MFLDRPTTAYKSGPWRKLVNDVIRAIDSKMCVRATNNDDVVGVDRGYMMRDSVDHADTIFYTRAKTGELVAFLLATWHDPQPGVLDRCGANASKEYVYPTLETTVVCSHPDHSAKPLMLESFQEARRRGIRMAELCALRHVKEYYPRYGYISTSPEGNVVHGWPFAKNLENPQNYYDTSDVPKKKICAHDTMVQSRRTKSVSTVPLPIGSMSTSRSGSKKTTSERMITEGTHQLAAHTIVNDALANTAAAPARRKKSTDGRKKKPAGEKKPRVRKVKKLPELPNVNSVAGLIIHTKTRRTGHKAEKPEAYVTKAGLHRLAKAQDHKFVRKASYPDTVNSLQKWLQKLIHNSLQAANAAGRTTLRIEDVRNGFTALTKILHRAGQDEEVYLTGGDRVFKHMRACHVDPSKKPKAKVHTFKVKNKESGEKKTVEYAIPEGGECLSFPQKPFRRLVKEITHQYAPKERFTVEALNAIQYLAEKHVSSLFKDSVQTIKMGGRVTLMPRNIRAVVGIRKHHAVPGLPTKAQTWVVKHLPKDVAKERAAKAAKTKAEKAKKEAEKVHESAKKLNSALSSGASVATVQKQVKAHVKKASESKKAAQKAATAAKTSETKAKRASPPRRQGGRVRKAPNRLGF